MVYPLVFKPVGQESLDLLSLMGYISYMTLAEFIIAAEKFDSDDFEVFYNQYLYEIPAHVPFVDLEKEFLAARARTQSRGMKGNISIQTGTTWKPKYQIGTKLVNTYNHEEREVFEVDTTNASYVLSNTHGYISLPEYVIDRDWAVKPSPYQYQVGELVKDKKGQDFVIESCACSQLGQYAKPKIEYTLRASLPQGGFLYQIVSEEVLSKEYTLVQPWKPSYTTGKNPWNQGTGIFQNGKGLVVPVQQDAAKIEFYRNGQKIGTIENGINNPPDGFLGCDHVFVDYQGLIESFRYCKKCDQRENR